MSLSNITRIVFAPALLLSCISLVQAQYFDPSGVADQPEKIYHNPYSLSIEERHSVPPLDVLAAKVGLRVSEYPDQGCSQSVIPEEKMAALVAVLKEPARSHLLQVADFSSALWQAQLYLSADGTGFCFPSQNRSVVIPGFVLSKASKVDLSQQIADSVQSLGDRMQDLFRPASQ